jgi:hypothetical protein
MESCHSTVTTVTTAIRPQSGYVRDLYCPILDSYTATDICVTRVHYIERSYCPVGGVSETADNNIGDLFLPVS